MNRKLSITLSLILIFAHTLLSQDFYEFLSAQNYNFIGAGARARGMGGAFIGVADDATASSWNPAGLVRLEKPEASIASVFESYTVTSDIDEFETDPWSHSHFGLNFVSVALPLAIGDRNLVASLSFQKVMDFYNKFDGYNSFTDEDYSSETTGGINAITPSIGLQLAPNISIGAALNIYTGKTEFSKKGRFDFFDEFNTSLDFSGTNICIGALFDIENFRLGGVFKTPFGLTIKEPDSDSEISLNLPQIIGLGAAFLPNEKWIFAFDYEMRKFSDAEFEFKDFDEKYSAEWEDINQIRLGAEYLMMSGNNILPIRFGFATTPTLFKDSNDDQISGGNLTAGVGLIMGNLNLDLGFEFNVYTVEIEDVGEISDNYFRFILAGVFHFGK